MAQINVASSEIISWPRTLGMLGAHSSFSEEGDNFLLEGYFGTSIKDISAEKKSQYTCMKHKEMLSRALHTLNISTELAHQALQENHTIASLVEAYKQGGAFSLTNKYSRVQLAIAMIRFIEQEYRKMSLKDIEIL